MSTPSADPEPGAPLTGRQLSDEDIQALAKAMADQAGSRTVTQAEAEQTAEAIGQSARLSQEDTNRLADAIVERFDQRGILERTGHTEAQESTEKKDENTEQVSAAPPDLQTEIPRKKTWAERYSSGSR